MPRTLGCLAAGLAMLAALAACDSGKKGAASASAPGGTAGVTASSEKGSGTAAIKVGSTQKTFAVTCVQSARATQATGNDGTNAVTLTVKGTPISVVVVNHDATGATTIYQAISGLRDDSGKAVGAVSVSGSGNAYSGTGTFVLTKLDSKGKRVKLTSGSTTPGTFQLSCTQGFAAPPTVSPVPSASPKSPTTAPSASKKH